MGLKVDQIATKSDLLKAGYFGITTNINDKECATYEDIHKLVTAGKIASSVEKWNTITPTVHLSNTSNTYTLTAGASLSYKIATYNLPTGFGVEAAKLMRMYAASSSYIDLSTNSSSSTEVFTYFMLCPGSQDPIASPDGVMFKTQSMYLSSSTTTVYMDFSTDINVSWPGYTSCSLYFVVASRATTSRTLYATFAYTSSNSLIMEWMISKKCIKYSDAIARIIRKPFYLGINEQVAGKTNANRIIVRYAYKTSSSAAEAYVASIDDTFNDPDTANGTFSKASHLECNARKLIAGVPYYARMTIWCGSTSSNQTWSYRVRKSDNTWTSWKTLSKGKSIHVDPLGDFPELRNAGVFATLLNGSGENDWLKAASNITGVEFKID